MKFQVGDRITAGDYFLWEEAVVVGSLTKPDGNFYYQVRVVLKDGRLGNKVREVWEGTQGLTKINYRNLNETSLKKQLYKRYIDDKGRLFVEKIKSYTVSYQKNSKKVACVSFVDIRGQEYGLNYQCDVVEFDPKTLTLKTVLNKRWFD